VIIIKYIDYKSRGLIPKLLVNRINKRFIKKEIVLTKDLLSNINGHSLDYFQRVAVVTDECANLVLAGAGSGKSLTIIGKIRYLIEFKKIKPEEILCITFTREATESLKNKIIKNYNYNIDVYTFHKLALSILSNKHYLISPPNTLEYITNEYFYMCQYNNIVKEKIKKILFMNNVPYNKILVSKELANFKRTIVAFINLFKTNNYKLIDFLNFKGDKNILRIIIDIYVLYEEELKSKMELDFNDMIVKAIKYVKDNGIKMYKYIIVDEYQDTSFVRYRLIKQIMECTGSKIMCVGDDYQSIYRFTGCDLGMFLNFKKYFGYTKKLTIQNTYRNSQELINVAGGFIMKNKKQLFKKLYSNKRINKPIKIMYGNNLEKLLDYVLNVHSNVMVLGRNNFDINKYFKLDGDYFFYKNKKIKYLTVHRSKGLEEESIIIINLKDDLLGFPNKKKNEKILENVLKTKDRFPYEEERRLFYVALTRSKSCVYLLVPRKNKSIFVKELIKDYSKYIEYL